MRELWLWRLRKWWREASRPFGSVLMLGLFVSEEDTDRARDRGPWDEEYIV